MSNPAKFFVLRLGTLDCRPSPEMRIEIQLLNDEGQGIASAYLGDGERDAKMRGEAIPHAVIEAAWRQPKGIGDYVDEDGKSVFPF